MVKIKKILFILFIFYLTIISFSCNRGDKFAKEGIAFLEQKKGVEALRSFEKALAKEKTNALALYGRGLILIQRSITAQIGFQNLKTALKSIKEKKYREKAFLAIANYQFEISDFNKAIQILENTLKVEKIKTPAVYNNLANYYARKNNRTKALETFNKAIKQFPQNADTYYNFALLMASKFKNIKKAYSLFIEADKYKPKQKDIVLNLVKASYLLNNKKQALSHLSSIEEFFTSEKSKKKYQKLKKLISSGKWKVDIK